MKIPNWVYAGICLACLLASVINLSSGFLDDFSFFYNLFVLLIGSLLFSYLMFPRCSKSKISEVS